MSRTLLPLRTVTPLRLAGMLVTGLFGAGMLLAGILPTATVATAAPIQWVTVGDPGNAPDTTGFGAVADTFRIMKHEFTNALYADYLNAVDPEGTGAGVWHDGMNALAHDRGGLLRLPGNPLGQRYAAAATMAAMPVNWVDVFQSAMVCNWYENGAMSYASSAAGLAAIQDGAYTLPASGSAFPAVNPGARYFLPGTEQWYKAAYYKGGGTTAGYWSYATSSDAAPAKVSATATGQGSLGGSSPVTAGNSANYDSTASWNGYAATVTEVGTNGGPSAYGAFDMGGNVWEWQTKGGDITQVIRGGAFDTGAAWLSSANWIPNVMTRDRGASIGFRLASSTADVPEIDPAGMASVLALVGGALGLLERRRAKPA